MRDGFWVISHKVMETYPKRPGLLRKKVGVIFNCRNFLSNWQKLLRQLFGNHFFKTLSEEVETGAKEVGFEQAYVVLAMHREVTILATDDELGVDTLATGEEVTVVGNLGGAVFKGLGFSFVVGGDGFALLNELVVVRVVTEDSLL